jgi:hypothetical protein
MTSKTSDPLLPAVVRLADGRVFEGELPASRHRRMHLALLHQNTSGLVELAAGRRDDHGSLRLTTRKRDDHYLPGGAGSDSEGWLEPIVALAAKHHTANEELFIAPTDRDTPGGHNYCVTQTRWLWVDVDEPARLPALWALFSEPAANLPHGRQPHLVIESGGASDPGSDGQPFGGVHALWKLAEPLDALTLKTAGGERIVNPRPRILDDSDMLIYSDPQTGEVFDGEVELTEWIAQANLRLIHALGYRFDRHGRQVPTVGDPACKDRGRVLRLAGSRHGKSGRYARIVFADLQRPGYPVKDLVGDLPDPKDRPAVRTHRNGGPSFSDDDPYKRIALIDVYQALTGREGSLGRKVRCPHRDHPDVEPSCNLYDETFRCWSCGAYGGIYQLASAVLGGPTEHLRGEQFKQAKQLIIDTFGERR